MNATASFQQIETALQYIPSDDRDIWIQIGMAIYNEYGDPGFPMWDGWSQSYEKYSEADARTNWRSFNGRSNYTIGTVFYFAKQHGWDGGETYVEMVPTPVKPPHKTPTQPKDIPPIWDEAKPVDANHPYLTRKGVDAPDTLREMPVGTLAAMLKYIPKSRGKPLVRRILIVPLGLDPIVSYEFIDEDGRKTAVAKVSKGESYWATHAIDDGYRGVIWVAEGVVTAITAAESAGGIGVSSSGSGRMRSVGLALQASYPDAQIVLLADLGKKTGRPLPIVQDTAAELDLPMAVPDFGVARDANDTDFNDLAARADKAAVAGALAKATVPPATKPKVASGTKSPSKTVKRLIDFHDFLAGGPFAGKIKFNALTNTMELHPGSPLKPTEIVPWADYLTTRIKYHFEQNYIGRQPSIGDLNAVIEDLAHYEHTYDPLMDWVEALKWDGTPRLDTWLIDYLGSPQDPAYLRAVGRSVLISAVARALEPGCKVDTMAVLKGGQGAKKSESCKALAPWPELFSDGLPDITRNDKDAEIHVASVSIQEVPEMASFRGSTKERVKSFLSRDRSRLRLPFGRHEIEIKRRCIFVGTTNRDDYLSDTSGNRRYLPVTVTIALPEDLAQHKTQLWAEAYAAYQAGENWIIETKGINTALADERSDVEEQDPWCDAIAAGLRYPDNLNTTPNGTCISVSAVLLHICGVQLDKQTKDHQRRASDVLRGLGWEKRRERKTQGQRQVLWYAPEGWNGVATPP